MADPKLPEGRPDALGDLPKTSEDFITSTLDNMLKAPAMTTTRH